MKTLHVYHGTNCAFDRFEQSKARVKNDLYGGGTYFTTSIEIGKSYARTMVKMKKDGIPIVYDVTLRLNKIFDVDDVFTGDDLVKIVAKSSNAEMFARGAKLLSGGNRISVLSALKSGSLELNGEQIFRGLSSGMINTADAKKKIISLGYDGLRYNGGLMEIGAQKHDVYIPYNYSSITINDRYIVKGPDDISNQNNPYKFI